MTFVASTLTVPTIAHFIKASRQVLSDAPRLHFHPVSINEYGLFRFPDYTLPLSVRMAEVSRDHRLDVLFATAQEQALWPEAKSVIALAMSYAPAEDPRGLADAAEVGRIARAHLRRVRRLGIRPSGFGLDPAELPRRGLRSGWVCG